MARTKRRDSEADGPAGAPAVPSESRRVTPVSIQQKEFRLAFRGYNERDVDVFLDEVTEEVARLYAENKRLREELDMRGVASLGGGDVDSLVRQAREEAGRILAEARAQAGGIAGGAAADGVSPAGGRHEAGGADAALGAGLGEVEAGAARSLIGAFLSREREFLQALAGLIQEHALGVREGATRARDQISAALAEAAAKAEPTVRPGPDAPRVRRPEARSEAATSPGPGEASPGPPPVPAASFISTGPSPSQPAEAQTGRQPEGEGPPRSGSDEPSGAPSTAEPRWSAAKLLDAATEAAWARDERTDEPGVSRAGPSRGSRPAPSAAVAPGPSDDDPPEPAGTGDRATGREGEPGAQSSTAQDGPEDRTIRELFWGEA